MGVVPDQPARGEADLADLGDSFGILHAQARPSLALGDARE
jgi:hypothetical protein